MRGGTGRLVVGCMHSVKLTVVAFAATFVRTVAVTIALFQIVRGGIIAIPFLVDAVDIMSLFQMGFCWVGRWLRRCGTP